MAQPALRPVPAPSPSGPLHCPVLDQDILSFCASSPQLVELAFVLADHGHSHVGHVARLTLFTLTDLADGDPSLARDLERRLQRCGLETGLPLEGWNAPADEFADEAGD